MTQPIHINIDDPDQVTALFDALARGSSPEELADMLRQCRIRRDNAEAQRDYEQERNEGWSVR